jgi:hypothetical protein
MHSIVYFEIQKGKAYLGRTHASASVETDVVSAIPTKLIVMLIDGALGALGTGIIKVNFGHIAEMLLAGRGVDEFMNIRCAPPILLPLRVDDDESRNTVKI